MSDRAEIYAEGLAKLVRVPTVTGVDRKSFAALRKVMAEEFPHVYSACEVIMPGGEGSDATLEQHLAVGGAAFVALLLEAGNVGKEAVLATVEHLFFEDQLTFDEVDKSHILRKFWV